jgi:hypothetical protein
MYRREFLHTIALAPTLWIDPRLLAPSRKPWRKIHLDFHNSQYVSVIGASFDSAEFSRRLTAAKVDAIVVFAKDMHGYFYYPSKFGPVHPGLSFDLLGAQVAACRKSGIAVYAYYCTTWDNYLAAHHEEWLTRKADGGTFLPKPGETPGWTSLCLANETFVQLMLEHAREFSSRYAIDGAWFDMPVPHDGECWCPACRAALGERVNDTAAQRLHKQQLEVSFLRRLRQTVQAARPGCQLDFNGQAVYGLGERVPYMDNIDLEALPSAAGWGYYYFPLVVRYTRTFGVTTYGMTGRFKASWADFGGLKLPAQLDTELAAIVANCARCDIGDQLPPSGRLDPAVYHVIGESYAKIAALEPYLEGAAPVTEAALLIEGLPLDGPNTLAHLGLTKLLIESRVQFDAVEPSAAWERYGLIVLPETLRVDAALARRLHTFIESGGAVLAVHESGRGWMERYGIAWAGLSPFKPAYLLPAESFTGNIPAYEYALYEGASQWKCSGAASVVAWLGEPAFQRTPEHYTSHAQSPFDHKTDFAVAARAGRAGLIGFPLGSSYFGQGYWVYRQLFQHMLDAVRPQRLLSTNAPLSAELTVTHQSKPSGRYLVHVINFSATRGTPNHPVFHEDPVPLHDIQVRLNAPVGAATARAVVSGLDLPVRRTPQGADVTIPRIAIHEVVVFGV